jgi:V8-like Glu-specific endopeptidase
MIPEAAHNPVEEFANRDPSSLFPPLLDDIEGVAELLQEHPGQELTYEKIYETICGVTDDSQEVEQYDGTLGVTVAFVNGHQSPVGQLQWNSNLASIYTNSGSFSGSRWCSGTLISDDLFLTAGHCLDSIPGVPLQNGTANAIQPAEIATNMHVSFDFQVDPSGNPRVEQSFPITQLVEYRLGGLDFVIVRLGGNPGFIYGRTQISNVDAVLNGVACIIGHPAGKPKRIEAGSVTLLQGNSIGYNDIDTLGGNSGSGILQDSDGRIVGVHTNGGCNAAMTGNNSGVRITSIIAQSPTLRLISVISPVIAAVFVGGRLTVFTRTLPGTLTHKFYDPQQQGWTDWVHLGDGEISSAPSAVMAGDRLTVFARTAHGTLTHKFYDPQQQGWTDWVHLGDGEISSAPSAVMAGDRLTVFARTTHGTLTHKFYDPQQQGWTDWVHLGDGEISSAPSAVMAGDRLTVFARTTHGTLTHKFYDPQQQGWTDWVHLGEGQIS